MLAAAISVMICADVLAASAISLKEPPVRFTNSVLFSTLMTVSLMRVFLFPSPRFGTLGQVSHFAGDDRETPPCSPARAASTAAFKASRFVWKAISFMTAMISATFLLDSFMSMIEFGFHCNFVAFY